MLNNSFVHYFIMDTMRTRRLSFSSTGSSELLGWNGHSFIKDGQGTNGATSYFRMKVDSTYVSDGGDRVWGLRGERLNDQHNDEIDAYGRDGVMIRAGTVY